MHSGTGNTTLMLSVPLTHGYIVGSLVTAPSVGRLRLRRVDVEERGGEILVRL